jgi:hypothetical protein
MTIIIAMSVQVTLFVYGPSSVVLLFFFCLHIGVFGPCFFLVIYLAKAGGKFLEMIVSMKPIFVRLFELVFLCPFSCMGGKYGYT